MSKERYEYWLCDDCVHLEETGDPSSFDYHYSSKEADMRFASCEQGLIRLHSRGQFFNDDTEEAQLECTDCGHIMMQADAEQIKDEWDEDVHVCPSCKGTEMRVRASGHDEFSWAGCDCCGSTLGGSLTRYSLFVEKEEA